MVAQATAYTPLHKAFVEAYNALMAARADVIADDLERVRFPSHGRCNRLSFGVNAAVNRLIGIA